MANIKIFEYESKLKGEWDNFVDNSNNGTMFHKQLFLDYHKPGKFTFNHLLFKKDAQLIGVLPGGLTDNGEVFWSPVGASYGSIVTNDVPYIQSLEMIDVLLDYSRDKNFKDIYLIPPPIIYNKEYNQHIEYSMLYRKFDFENSYISHAVPLNKGVDYFSHYDAKARRIIRKIEKDGDLRVEINEDFAGYYPILEKNKAKHGVKPTHSLDDLIKLNELMQGKIKLIMIYFGDIPVAGSLLFLTNSKVALCFYIMMDYDYNQMHPVFMAMNESIKWSSENGYEWFDIGVSQDTTAEDPMTPSLNLIYFKERFHSRGLLRTTFHYKFRD